METTCKTAVAAAVAGGYVLGRTKKAKLALGLVMFVAGKRLKLSPADLAAAGMRQISENPQLAGLRDQVRDELLTAVKTAASSTMDRQVSSLAGSLRDRTGALSGLGGKAEEADEDEHEDEEAHAEDEEPEQDESEEEDEEEDEGDESEEAEPEASKQRAAHGRRTGRSGGTSSRARQTPKKEPAKRAPAKRAAPKSASKKTTPQRQSGSGGSGRAKSGSAGRSGSGRQGR